MAARLSSCFASAVQLFEMFFSTAARRAEFVSYPQNPIKPLPCVIYFGHL
jgi:hypothetical protein